MSELLPNYLGGAWVCGEGPGIALIDPLNGRELARVSSAGLDLVSAFQHARTRGAEGLGALTYEERAKRLSEVVAVLKQHRERYLQISLENSGTTTADSSIDVDGAIFTLGYFAKAGLALGAARYLRDRDAVDLARDGSFKVQHLLVPRGGVTLLINAFNFPAWGLWEKAAPALLSGSPVIVKPATATAWLAHEMVRDVIAAGVLPEGALSLVCGRSEGLLDALRPLDALSFTGSATTAATLRRHEAIATHSLRVNIESDSVNSAVLMPDADPSSPSFGLFVREVVRELTSKSGQKCTAVRRAFVPAAHYGAVAEAIGGALAGVVVGDPRNPAVTMGSLVSRAQRQDIEAGIATLRSVATTLVDGSTHALIDVPSADSAVVAPWLFGVKGKVPAAVHTTEVFGPAATLIAYDDIATVEHLVARGEGSLVCSIFGNEPAANAQLATRLAPWHGRVHIVSPAVAKTQTGHGNVMPMANHGGPGRAGGGQELGGLRALEFYHQRCAVQAEAAAVDVLAAAPPWSY